MKPNTVPLWPAHQRPDMERDKYGPLPNTNIPIPVKKAKHHLKPLPHDQSVNVS